MMMVNEDYIPNLELQDHDDEDSHASISFIPSQWRAAQIQEKPVVPEVETSNGSDTSTSKGWLPPEDYDSQCC